MAVHISPATALSFNRPFDQPVKRILTVTNRNRYPVAFKVKTTAPKAYCVRPNSGRIEPDESVEVQVILQGIKPEPMPGSKCKDKFLVQSMAITDGMHNMTLGDMWSLSEQAPDAHPSHQQRIKVVWLPPEGSRLDELDEPVDSTFMTSPNDSNYHTIRQPISANGSHDYPGIPSLGVDPVGDRGASPAGDFHAASDTADHIVAAPAVLVTEPMTAPLTPPHRQHHQDGDTELRRKYAEAQDEIARLRALLESVPAPSTAPLSDVTGLRRRSVAGESTVGDATTEVGDDDGKSTIGFGLQQQDGVPPQVVAIIALVVFTLTYLFF